MAGASAFDHVAGEGEGRSAETDDGKFSGEMFRDLAHRFGNIAEVGGAIGAEFGYVFRVRTGFSITGPSPAEK